MAVQPICPVRQNLHIFWMFRMCNIVYLMTDCIIYLPFGYGGAVKAAKEGDLSVTSSINYWIPPVFIEQPLTVVSARLIGQFGLNLWGETSDCVLFFLVRATEKTKTVLDQKIPPKNYRSAKCWPSVFKHLKKIGLKNKIFWKNPEIYLNYNKITTFSAFILWGLARYSVHSTATAL